MEKNFCYKYPHPAITADCVIFGFDNHRLSLLLIERKNNPYKGFWAFPGGFVNIDETVEEAVIREVNEETGIHIREINQLHTYSAVNRDPRERVITVAFCSFVRKADYENIAAGDDADKVRWFPISKLPPLAFDHSEILNFALKNAAHLNIMNRISSDKITKLAPNEIFVFGSNLSGAHGGGAARIALQYFGAIWGQGIGLQGQSYGIPTMHGGIIVIRPYIDDFLDFAEQHPEYQFLVTRIGCGIAGFTDREIAPLFERALNIANIYLPLSFINILTV